MEIAMIKKANEKNLFGSFQNMKTNLHHFVGKKFQFTKDGKTEIRKLVGIEQFGMRVEDSEGETTVIPFPSPNIYIGRYDGFDVKSENDIQFRFSR